MWLYKTWNGRLATWAVHVLLVNRYTINMKAWPTVGFFIEKKNGSTESRSLNLSLAKRLLSHLSYTPFGPARQVYALRYPRAGICFSWIYTLLNSLPFHCVPLLLLRMRPARLRDHTSLPHACDEPFLLLYNVPLSLTYSNYPTGDPLPTGTPCSFDFRLGDWGEFWTSGAFSRHFYLVHTNEGRTIELICIIIKYWLLIG